MTEPGTGPNAKKPLADILGRTTPESDQAFGYHPTMRATNYGVPGLFVVASVVLLPLWAMGDIHGGKHSVDWFWPVLCAAMLAFAYVFGWRFGVHVRVEGHTLTWRAPYSRRRSFDLVATPVQVVTYPWMGTGSLRMTDGSKVAIAVNTEDWNDFLVALDRRQGTALASASRFTPAALSWGEGFFRER